MPNLYLIDGAAGSGKSAFLDYCKNVCQNSEIIKKYTTKEQDCDGILREDLIYCKPDDYDSHPNDYFVYNYPKHSDVMYFISKKILTEKLKENKNVFLIIRSGRVIQEIKKYYATYVNVNVVTIFLYCDQEQLKIRTRKQIEEIGYYSSDELEVKIKNRLSRNKECLRSYINSISENEKKYDYVILNDLEKDEYFTCINNIIHKFDSFDNQFCPPTVFIIMPMPTDREGAHFLMVKEAIANGAEARGFVAIRQDDKHLSATETIHESILQEINKSTICIADITKARPNCYYELGHALSKSRSIRNTMIIVQQGEKIEFDVEGLERNVYTFHPKDYSQITNMVKKWLNDFIRVHLLLTSELASILKLRE